MIRNSILFYPSSSPSFIGCSKVMASYMLKLKLQASLYLASMIFSVAASTTSDSAAQLPIVLRRFGTKTAYSASVVMDNLDYNPLHDSGKSNLPPNSRPVQVVGLFRHGTRYPGDKDILGARDVLARISKLSASKPHSADRQKFLDGLTQSLQKYDLKDCKELSESGRFEHIGLGKRFYSEYKNLFSTDSQVLWYSSKKSRSINSCKGFQEGFSKTSGRKISREIIERDDLLRFFDGCDRYIERVASNKTSRAEVKRFQEMKYGEVVERVSSVLGVEGLEISAGEMKAMHVMSGSEIAVHGTSNWSQLFNNEDLEILEYAADIKNYWKKGYGYPINYEQGCILLHHMFSHMDKIVNKDTNPEMNQDSSTAPVSGVFYFGHTETVIPILSLLGLFNDSQPIVADNFNNGATRQFRTSRISPFSSNLAFVLYECPVEEGMNDENSVDGTVDGSGDSGDNNGKISAGDGQPRKGVPNRRYMVELLFKEMPLRWPACGSTACDYETVRDYYARYIDKCAFEEMCRLKESEAKAKELKKIKESEFHDEL